MDHIDTKEESLKRLKIAKGHLDKVIEMLAGDVYCPDVIHQSQAVQAALKKVDELILHGHLHSCVLKDMHGPNGENEKIVNEIVELFKKK
ncbi:hypothetical protein A2955_03560 [Candidatus Woesebacteria bacterium RIFCSPLOWO2_01_FULL_37_19]|uniref:Copper-sensing transcriptional repressor CsoR n=2 Tax=Candidatus Woeseibacteriota TaxID=1752722 RepID=A0A1F8B6Y5_9BACT|nr:MAG: hypothetical protein A2771_02555 [Candidatus Woesebacteria bacterium RIFCSPHIGHO2_01_FULL_38_26b]OGM59802.1 MAG: hypothetical protein A2955_03560 [Candidatus Woesebacteria bacterium RIFCSPLOWO2_01_FULL_37_19]